MKVNWDDMSLSERALYISNNADRIFVRAQTEEGWKSVALSSLPEQARDTQAWRLVQKEHPPYMAIKP